MEQKISNLIENTINLLGFNLVKVTVKGSARKIVEVSIEKKDGSQIQVQDCSKVSKNISALLDVENIISDNYFLEVSSAGLERSLVTLEDFKRFIGREIKIRLQEPMNGSFTYKGKLIDLEDQKILLQSKNVKLSFNYNNIKKANLVFTDEMFRKLLNKKK